MSSSTPITVVGGGLAGLIAAISAAEAGASVNLHEAHSMLGGRARTSQAPFRANLGPHAIYADGALWAWLRARRLHQPAVRPAITGLRFRHDGALRSTPPLAALRGLRSLRDAPVDETFSAWVARRRGEAAARQLAGFAGVATFTADPGALSAAFVAERVRRATHVPPTARFVVGGWSVLVERLAARARTLGVTIHLGSRVDAMPSGPVVVATELATARRLLDDPTLVWSGARTALLDIGVVARRGDPWVVSDLDEAGWIERFSKQDPSLAPVGHSLVQAQLGLRTAESLDDGVARIERILDLAFDSWRDREVWRRRSVSENRSGALDPPGTTWRDRPAIDRGDGVYLCGDMVASPGLLAEVSCNSAVTAAALAVAAAARGVGAIP